MMLTIEVTKGDRSATFAVQLPQFIESNEDRADMVRPLVQAFGFAFYGDGDSPSEELDTILPDMIADLFHLADRVAVEVDERGTETLGADNAYVSAYRHYAAEIEDES